MGFLTKNPTQSVNPNSPQMQALQGDFATFLQGLMKGGGAAQGMTGDLQRQGMGGVQSFLNQASPEQTTFNQLQPGLIDIFGLDTAGATGAAAMPLFQQGLQFAQGQLANSGMGRFSTAFENQGIGLSQRALQDFNLLQQQAFQQNIGNRLGAAQMLGSLSGSAGSSMRDPILQLLLGGMNFASPAPNDTVVGKSWLDHLTGIASVGLAAKGGGGGGKPSWADVWGGNG